VGKEKTGLKNLWSKGIFWSNSDHEWNQLYFCYVSSPPSAETITVSQIFPFF